MLRSSFHIVKKNPRSDSWKCSPRSRYYLRDCDAAATDVLDRRAVRFADQHESYSIQALECITAKEIEASYYSPDECRAMKLEADRAISAIDEGCEDVETRGLEIHSAEGVWTTYKKRRDLYDIILDEQDKQMRSKKNDWHAIAKLNKMQSAKCLEEAICRGKADEEEAKICYSRKKEVARKRENDPHLTLYWRRAVPSPTRSWEKLRAGATDSATEPVTTAKKKTIRKIKKSCNANKQSKKASSEKKKTKKKMKSTSDVSNVDQGDVTNTDSSKKKTKICKGETETKRVRSKGDCIRRNGSRRSVVVDKEESMNGKKSESNKEDECVVTRTATKKKKKKVVKIIVREHDVIDDEVKSPKRIKEVSTAIETQVSRKMARPQAFGSTTSARETEDRIRHSLSILAKPHVAEDSAHSKEQMRRSLSLFAKPIRTVA